MPVKKLPEKRVPKPWGRRELWPGFQNVAADEAAIGEIWFPSPVGENPELLIKYLFTCEKLSVQVHPDDAAANAQGYPRGKDEAWLVLAAEPESTIALGPKRRLSAAELRAAALDGSIVELLEWRPVKAGDFIYSPAGTIHALGAGLTVIEIQQNLDLTYRLYDYGRPRELHLDEGIACANLDPFVEDPGLPASQALAPGGKFIVERLGEGVRNIDLRGKIGWLIPINGDGQVVDCHVRAGECWTVTNQVRLELGSGSAALLAYTCS